MQNSDKRSSYLCAAMIAYHLAQTHDDKGHIKIHASFPYSETNPYFYELYVNQDYWNEDDQPVSWYEFASYRDLRDDEVDFLKSLSEKQHIKNLKIEWVMEEDYAETGRSAKRPKTYIFDTQPTYKESLKSFINVADNNVYIEAELKLTDMLVPKVIVRDKEYKWKALSPDGKAGQILEYCYVHSLDKVTTLDVLKEHTSIKGVSSIRDALRGSIFYYKDGPLRDFVEDDSSRIKLKPKANILLVNLANHQTS